MQPPETPADGVADFARRRNRGRRLQTSRPTCSTTTRWFIPGRAWYTTGVSYVGRYAPSPTGDLHLGNLFAAVWATYRARRAQGRLLLRIEDLDHGRCKPVFTEHILEDLDVLGFQFDAGPGDDDPAGPFVQSQRRSHYDDALRLLDDKGLLYRCRCSRKDLARIASAPHVGDDGPIYPGTCRPDDVVVEDHELSALRFIVPDDTVCVDDHWAGRFCQHLPTDVGDFVVRRKDDVIAYHLAVVVDDALQGVTEVVRGRDLLSSSPRQVALFHALDHPAPTFAHLPLWVDDTGHRLAKRRGEETLRALLQRESPGAILGRVGRVLGVSDDDEPLTLDVLLQRIDDDMGKRDTVGG